MKKLSKYIFITLTISASVSFAQKNKADKYYEKLRYAKAIPAYEKAIKKNSDTKQDALIKLADCYRILNEYGKAETYYKEAIAIGKAPADAYYNYGNVLKSNNKYPEALNQFYTYLEDKPTDSKAKNAIKSCQEIKYWESKPKEYEVKNIEAINTNRAEFCPTLFNNQLVYVAEKVSDIVDFEQSGTNNQPFLNLYSSEIKNNKFLKSKSFSSSINTAFHDGPISFSGDGKMAFFTRINYIVNKKNKNFVNRAKIYMAAASGKKWAKAIPFQYNSDDYSCAHPSISGDGNTMYFASDMPGGQGGQDIWVTKRNGDTWGKPVNLGIDINTSGDELFPFIRKDGILFFSSNGLPGFGDLDIFSAKTIEGRWLLNRNEGLFLNSTADDFGVVFATDSTGYFSSNKIGGKGSDDIYSFKYTNKNITVDGIVLLTESPTDPAKGVKVYLLNEQGKFLDSTKTDDKGYFAFKDLDVEKVYMAEVDETNTTLKNKSRYYLADKNGTIARVTHKEGIGKKFVFKNLPVNPNGMPDLFSDDDLSLAGNLLYGESPSKPIANKKIMIKNEFGDVVEETTTNEFGAFAFRNLPIDQNYTLSFDDSDIPVDSKIILTNKSGKEVKLGRSDSKGKFTFAVLNTDKTAIQDLSIDDIDMVMSLNGYLYDQNHQALTNAKVSILSNSAVVEEINTDDKGKFAFKNLSADKNYVFGFDESDVRFGNVTKILVADSKGRVYREIKRDKTGKFVFELLDIDKTAFGDFTVDDPWLQVLEMKNKQKQDAITIVEKLRYAYGDYKIDAAGINILDKVISILNNNKNLNIELSSHTDSRSTDSYNLILSQKRAKAAVDYMIAKGIAKTRLKAVGYGESRLLNHCKSDVPCSEEEHAINRRTEFKIVEIGKL